MMMMMMMVFRVCICLLPVPILCSFRVFIDKVCCVFVTDTLKVLTCKL